MAPRRTADAAPVARDTSIAAYRAKRDFTRTGEPPPGSVAAASESPVFVVQKHDASRLHYDFRLEHDGVLWSWAVPRGPSMDPHDKRLAVHVEDHPLGYAGFEGTIPAGEYGAGTVEIWDRGTWAGVGADPAADMARGEMKFTLDGSRLQGRFVLIRLKPRPKEHAENWLLIKEHDEHESAGTTVAELEAVSLAPLPHTRSRKRAAGAERAGHGRAARRPARLAGAATRRAADRAARGRRVDQRDQARRLPAARVQGRQRCPPADPQRAGLDPPDRGPRRQHRRGAGPCACCWTASSWRCVPDGRSSFPDLQAALSDGRTDGADVLRLRPAAPRRMGSAACRLDARKAVLAGAADLVRRAALQRPRPGDAGRCASRPARWASRASSPSGSTPPTGPAAAATG